MRVLEIVLLILCTILPFYQPHWDKKITLAAVALLAVLHLYLEGMRWQLLLVYLLLLLTSRLLLREKSLLDGKRAFMLLKVMCWVIVLLPAWLLPYTLPVPELPKPTGAYSVGAKHIHLTTSVEEDITKMPNDNRELMIKVWYPAEIHSEGTEPYLDKGERLGFTTKYGIPSNTLHYLDYVKTYTYQSPAVKDGIFPVLLFSPGIYSSATGYHALIEEIVSHGYIVMNVNHTYESMGSLFPNGQVRYYDKAYDALHNNQETGEMIWKATQDFKNATTDIERQKAIHYAVQNYVAAEVNERWTRDLTLVLEATIAWNTSSFLAGHIDTNRIGAVGHSQGGSAAAQLLLENPSIKAGINIDGVHWGGMIDTSMSKPFMLLQSEWDEFHPNFNKYIYAKTSTSDFYEILLSNSGHASFMDIPLMLRIPVINEAGTIDPKVAHLATSAVVIRFFDKYLKGKKETLQQVCHKYPSLSIIRQ